MGLFIGASVLTILEIFDYLYEVKPELQKDINEWITDNNQEVNKLMAKI